MGLQLDVTFRVTITAHDHATPDISSLKLLNELHQDLSRAVIERSPIPNNYSVRVVSFDGRGA